jgi:RNA-directed DNA polymerase
MEYTARTLRAQAARFSESTTPEHAAVLLLTKPHLLQLRTIKPQYHIYEIPKKDGGRRLIEDPHLPLKKLQRHLNRYLQACYFMQRPAAVYGFCISTRHEVPRNIVTHAAVHCGCRHMLNLDLRDFFHSITEEKVRNWWLASFPRFSRPLVELLTALVTFRGRLPMGSPCSPVISNFAVLDMDHELMTFARTAGLRYTRYADDLTFSSQKPVTLSDQQFIRSVITHYGFSIQEKKWRLYSANDPKMVTGLLVTADDVRLPDAFTHQLSHEIERLRSTMLVEQRYQTGMSYRKLGLLRQELAGKIRFAAMVLGQSDPLIIRLHNEYEQALHPPADFESAGWLEVPYQLPN